MKAASMSPHERRVANLIQVALQRVTLGDGVGLWQGQGIDDYADSQTLADYHNRDEKQDWSRIQVEDLNRCYSSLSFFDAEGMRFHLPAFLITDLEGLYSQDVIFHLTSSENDNLARFELLDTAQRTAVREFLLLRLPGRGFEQETIETALTEYLAAE